jgi:hypothetical protein
MVRRLIPALAAVVLVVGCKKKTEGIEATAPSDASTAYTITVREEHKGQKVHVVRSSSGTSAVIGGAKTESDKGEERYDYTEEVLEMPAGAKQPTKLRRVYKTAEKSEKGGPMRPTSYAGKTVVIEKKGERYKAAIDGKPAHGGDAASLTSRYAQADKLKIADILPKQPVKVSDSWTVEPEALKKFAATLGMTLDPAKSSITGRLTKVYTRGGKQWGVLEYKIDLTVLPAKGGKGATGGKFTGDMTLDTPIDGSSRQGTMKSTFKAAMDFTQDGKSGKFTLEGSEEETITPVK